MFGAVGAIGLGLLGLVGVLALGGSKPATNLTLTEQIQAYGVMAVPGQSGPRRDDAPSTPSPARPARQPRRRWPTTRTSRRGSPPALEAAGTRPAAGRVAAPARRGACVVGGLLGLLLGAGNLVLGVLVVVVGAIGPSIYLKVKRRKRLKAFSTGLADTLQLMSGSLSAGLSLAQSIDTIVREGTEPISGEFRRVVIETRLGVTLEDSMEGVAERMESRDFTWVVMAIRIQREVGGNLAELLLTVAATLREREYLRRHVRALSAEGRLSCYVLGGLPPGFLLYLTLTKPEYVKPMYTTPIGWILLAGMAVLARRRHVLDVQGRKGGCVMSPVVIVAFVLIFARAVPGLRRRRRHLQGAAPASTARSRVLEALTTAPEEMKGELDVQLRRPGAVPAARPHPGAWAGGSRPRTPATASARSSSWPATRAAGPSSG